MSPPDVARHTHTHTHTHRNGGPRSGAGHHVLDCCPAPRTAAEAFRSLRGAVRVLCVDDERSHNDLMREYLEDFGLFSVRTVCNAQTASKAIRDGSFHFCLSDLGLYDLRSDQFALFRLHGDVLPVFALSGRREMNIGAQCMEAGAAWVEDKLRFHTEGSRAYRFLMKAVTYGVLGWRGAYRILACRSALDALIEHYPRSVEEWAGLLGTDCRDLRRHARACGAKALALLKLFHLLSAAFRHCWVATGREAPGGCLLPLDYGMVEKAADYWFLNRSEFCTRFPS